MKKNKLFDFAIGNPPYQDDKKGESNTATPVYHIFMDACYEVADKVELITLARFLFNAGYTPTEWNEKMLNDPHLKVLSYVADGKAVFPDNDIKGGVAITYRDQSQSFGAIRIFTQYPEVNRILRKVGIANGFSGLDSIIVTSFAYHYTKNFYNENKQFIGRSSAGHEYDLQSNTFSVFPEAYSDKQTDEDQIRILGRVDNRRCWRYINRRYVTKVSNLDSYKVFYPKATGKGTFGETLPEAIIGKPGDGNTVTFISIGSFHTEDDASNCIKYTKTKFARAMLSVLKVTQDNTPAKWKYVPLQDFTSSSDIDWSQSVKDIDQQLYRKYRLSDDEIEFIETHVKEMN